MAERDRNGEAEEGGFLSRWSRRKREGVPEADEPREATTLATPDPLAGIDLEADELPEELIEAHAENLTGEQREMLENRRAAEALDLDAMQYESDFTPFLKRGVPRSLRSRALQRLWRSNPLLANVDGLNDYDADYGDPALNTFKSIWQVGRGFLTDADRDPVKAAFASVSGEGDSGQTTDAGSTDTGLEPAEDEQQHNTPEAVETAGDQEPVQQAAETSAEIAGEEWPARVSLRKRLFDAES